MKPQQFGLTDQERDEKDKNRRARNCGIALAVIIFIACCI